MKGWYKQTLKKLSAEYSDMASVCRHVEVSTMAFYCDIQRQGGAAKNSLASK